MERPEFSVSVCVYGGDCAQWFKTAVDSVLQQSVKPSEIVLVVDGPVPQELHEIICEYENNVLFNVIRLSENLGHGEARRIGLKACKNELVALMDADDICMPNRFEKQLECFEKNPEFAIVGGNITEFLHQPENIIAQRVVPRSNDEIRQEIKKRCPFNQVTVMFKKSAVESVGGYIDWYCEEDYYLWLRMYLASMKFHNLSDVLVNVRVGEEMYNRRGGIRYFKSEAKLQKYMLDNGIIGFSTYVVNVMKRLIVQVLLPNRLRGWVFQRFARKSVN